MTSHQDAGEYETLDDYRQGAKRRLEVHNYSSKSIIDAKGRQAKGS
jgi:hypothetical protein